MEQSESTTLGFLLADASRLLRKRFEAESRDLAMTSAQLHVMARLRRNEGIGQAALAAMLELEPMTLCRHIDRMEAAGLVERRPDPADRRARRLFTTDAGRELLFREREGVHQYRYGRRRNAASDYRDAVHHVVRRISANEPVQANVGEARVRLRFARNGGRFRGCFGGGTRGNISAGMAKTLVTPVDGIDDGQVMNRFEAAGGRDEEGLDEARVRASRSLRSRDRAVTAEDFEQLAQEAANVKRAKALPLYHPNFPGTQIPGVVSVIIVPDSEADRPTPSDGTMRAVCAYLDKRRLLTTEVFVLRPTYQQVEVSGEILVDDDADLLRLLAIRLEAAGHVVATAPNAERSLGRNHRQRPRLVFGLSGG